MAGLFAYGSLAPKTKNMVVAGGLTAFVFGVYFYTMRAVGGTDELQVAIDKFEELKKQEGNGLIVPKHDHQQIPQKPLQTHYPSPSCVVATGGLHGDLEKTMQAFRLGGLIDGSNYWFGVSTTVVQIGGVIKILYFLKMLKREAVTIKSLEEVIVWAYWYGVGINEEARTAPLRPNGPISRRLLADNATFLMVGDFVLVHGGVLRNMWIMGWRGRCYRKRGLGLLIPEHSPVEVSSI
ncbi:hypothetical protein CXB51_026282 [Gossypium anomalum]|uniref:Cytochrome c oxidase assembly factor 3 mitochondrial coiled-coil domain-containing protein n=1 Tax=Gossypium anomalum TaxID=47600 RepID=A0A8J5YRW9_9ROSI|nr:hypothetical protein CXB51_026282 [Gossypium anomalum]